MKCRGGDKEKSNKRKEYIKTINSIMDKEKDKDTIYDLIYLRHILNPINQKLLNQDNDDINSHLFNVASIINENKILSKENKEILINIITDNLN